jgi:hypothetical protein
LYLASATLIRRILRPEIAKFLLGRRPRLAFEEIGRKIADNYPDQFKVWITLDLGRGSLLDLESAVKKVSRRRFDDAGLKTYGLSGPLVRGALLRKPRLTHSKRRINFIVPASGRS